MPCAEITDAIAWSKKSTSTEAFPVHAYFTKHFGYSAPSTGHRDAIFYASGPVIAVDAPSPHLKGLLTGAKNSDKAGEMLEPTGIASLTFDVEIYPDGTISYLMKLNGKPVGGLPATKVKATCVNNVLLTAATGSDVVTVGVARKPSVAVPVSVP